MTGELRTLAHLTKQARWVTTLKDRSMWGIRKQMGIEIAKKIHARAWLKRTWSQLRVKGERMQRSNRFRHIFQDEVSSTTDKQTRYEQAFISQSELKERWPAVYEKNQTTKLKLHDISQGRPTSHPFRPTSWALIPAVSRGASDHGSLVTLKGSDVRSHSQEADWSIRQKKSSVVVRTQSAPSLTSSDPADPSDVVTRQFRSVKAPDQTDLLFSDNGPCSADPKNNCTKGIQSLDNVTPSAKSDQYPSQR
ncbi:unnamed protein product [Calicophoron daubneyi]|uniref:Uncharacterized protein n=1 Tax=Calicophoron daubneyi TaxID=300641 RepID=A0AAV2TJX6_CALDB